VATATTPLVRTTPSLLFISVAVADNVVESRQLQRRQLLLHVAIDASIFPFHASFFRT
jgi:hypothetical protein